jgi:hypothetical protein
MLSLDDRPVPPEVPWFSRKMEEFLVSAAQASPARRPSRRRVRYAAVGLAAAAVAAATALGIDYGTAGGPSPGGSPATTQGGVHIHLAAFSVVANADGTVTLTLNQGQLFDPSTLREALAKAGVPALVTVGSVCTAPFSSDALPQVISRAPGQPGGRSVTTITPSAIPSGEELSIGYFANGNGLHISLVPDNAHLTCRTAPPFTAGQAP